MAQGSFTEKFVSLTLLLSGQVLLGQEPTVAWKQPAQPVFVVTPNHYAEGFTPDGATPRFGDLIMIEILNPAPKNPSSFASYTPGQQVTLYSGGENVGSVSIQKSGPLQCDSNAAVVSLNSSLPFSKDVIALATNAGIRTHKNVKRPVNAAEQAMMIQVAMAELRKQGIIATNNSKFSTDHLVATSVDGSGATTLIGLVSVELNKVRHETFLIVRVAGSQPVVEMSRYHKTTDLDDGKDSQNLRFADQLDLDGDGVDELVVELTGYESEEFRVYKRRGTSWTQVAVGGQGGC